LNNRVSIDPADIGAPFHEYDWDGQCRPPGRFTLTQVLAHELGHAYLFDRGQVHDDPLVNEYNGAMVYENMYLQREGRRLRCRY
jgi:hypothetical protein